MPNPTEASLNNLRQATPALEIQGPSSNELPATWLYGETIPLTATGGNGRYQWLTTAPEAASIRHRQDNRCEVAIEGTAAAQILAFSAGDRAIYKGLQGTQPLLKAVDNRPRNLRSSGSGLGSGCRGSNTWRSVHHGAILFPTQR